MKTITYIAPHDGALVTEWPDDCAGVDPVDETTGPFMTACTSGKRPIYCETVDVFDERLVLCYCEDHIEQMARYRLGDEYEPSGRPKPKPCGYYHPLPCGLDKDCELPLHYLVDHDYDDAAAWEAYLDDWNEGGVD